MYLQVEDMIFHQKQTSWFVVSRWSKVYFSVLKVDNVDTWLWVTYLSNAITSVLGDRL